MGTIAWDACWRRSARRWERLGRAIAEASGWQVWNPGRYGETWHARFRQLYRPQKHPLLLFGLNPGPYGMAQTGIPFTDLKRLVAQLPRLATALQQAGIGVQVPGLAPASLRPYLTRTFESSSVRVYRFLELAFGSAEAGWRQAVVANPCPLLFMDRQEKRNRTPADLRRAIGARNGGRGAAAGLAAELMGEMDRLRRRNSEDAVNTLAPRGVVLLGKNAQAALGPCLRQHLDEARIIDWEHPARAVPETWSRGLRRELRRRALN